MVVNSDFRPANKPFNGLNIRHAVNGINAHRISRPVPTHPLGPLTAEEIKQSSRLMVQSWPEGTLFRFKVIKLREPAKSELVPYLKAERSGQSLPAIDRLVDVVYYIKNTVGRLLL